MELSEAQTDGKEIEMLDSNQKPRGKLIVIEGLSVTNRRQFRNFVVEEIHKLEREKESGVKTVFCKALFEYWSPIPTKQTPMVALMGVATKLVEVLVDQVLPALNRGDHVVIDGYFADIYAAYGVRYNLTEQCESLRDLVELDLLPDVFKPDVTFLRWDGDNTEFDIPAMADLEAAAFDDVGMKELKDRVLNAYQEAILLNPFPYTVVDSDLAIEGKTVKIVKDTLQGLFNSAPASQRGCSSVVSYVDDAAYANLSVGEIHDKLYKDVVVGQNQLAVTEFAVMSPPTTP